LKQACKNLFQYTTSASIPVVTVLRSSLSMYVFFVYNKFSFFVACFVNSSLEVTFWIALVCVCVHVCVCTRVCACARACERGREISFTEICSLVNSMNLGYPDWGILYFSQSSHINAKILT
jgi:hypothetical protein